MKWLRLFSLLNLLLLLSACAVIDQAKNYRALGCAKYLTCFNKVSLDVAVTKQLEAAEKTLNVFYREPKNHFLQYVELGTIRFLAKDYRASLNYFDQAEALIKQQENRPQLSASQFFKQVSADPSTLVYQPSDMEKLFVDYYQLLNYLLLAQPNGNGMDKAQVEAKQIDIRLAKMQFEQGSYQQRNNSNQNGWQKVWRVFEVLSGRYLDSEQLKYRNDAFLRYIQGVTYELNRRPDNAYVAYKQSEILYDEGFSEQYKLSHRAGQQATEDKIRMDRSINQQSGQLLVIEHNGHMVPKMALPLRVFLDTKRKRLVIQPDYVSNLFQPTKARFDEQRIRRAWFRLIYGETGALQMVGNLALGGVGGAIRGIEQKSYYLGPVWQQVKSSGLIEAFASRQSISIEVPYYPVLLEPQVDANLIVNGKRVETAINAESLSMINIQALMLDAGNQLRHSVTREVLRAVGIDKSLTQSVPEEYRVGVQLITTILDRTRLMTDADLRSWMLLPANIRLYRTNLPPGEHNISLQTPRLHGYNTQQQVTIRPGQLTVATMRTWTPAKGGYSGGIVYTHQQALSASAESNTKTKAAISSLTSQPLPLPNPAPLSSQRPDIAMNWRGALTRH